jgi:pimeloyl-ACP methyl ester carboxylesterase
MSQVLPLKRAGSTKIEVSSRTIHGYKRAFRTAGSDASSALLLIHGIGDNSSTWLPIMPKLASRHLVIAPDLLGHGLSDKPRADYSIGGFANGMRDLLAVLGIDRVTLVGHSLGGGVAFQFAYQYPEYVERVVLVGSGGVGKQVSVALRAASVPGASLAIGALRLPGMKYYTSVALKLLALLDTDMGVDAPDLIRVVEALPDLESRRAFVATLRSVVDWRGQVVTALDRSYLAAGLPVLLMWGDRDPILSERHGRLAHEVLPGSRYEVFEGAGHFPFRADPNRFVTVLEDFIATTEPPEYTREEWRERLRTGPAVPISQIVRP